MNDQETIQEYCYDEAAFDYHDRAYIPLQVADAPEQSLRIPENFKTRSRNCYGCLLYDHRANRRRSAPARQKDRNLGI